MGNKIDLASALKLAKIAREKDIANSVNKTAGDIDKYNRRQREFVAREEKDGLVVDIYLESDGKHSIQPVLTAEQQALVDAYKKAKEYSGEITEDMLGAPDKISAMMGGSNKVETGKTAQNGTPASAPGASNGAEGTNDIVAKIYELTPIWEKVDGNWVCINAKKFAAETPLENPDGVQVLAGDLYDAAEMYKLDREAKLKAEIENMQVVTKPTGKGGQGGDGGRNQ